MCGISAYIERSKKNVSGSVIQKMNDKIAHRGPDYDEVYVTGSVGLGHRRLSIIDLSSQANQPYHFNQYTLIFNGEIYNYKELKCELIEAGYAFQTASDTEVLILAYQHWGRSCVNYFNGMWAFVIYDNLKKEVFASRDRFGIKPLYFFVDEETILFSSEIKQIQAIKPQKINYKIFGEFIDFGYLNHTDETFFLNIELLPAGNNLVYSLDTDEYAIEQYYNLEKNTLIDLNISYEEACKEFQRLFDSAISLRLRADVKLGLTFSGGLDSSCIAVKADQKNIDLYSVVYNDKYISEKKYIDAFLEKYNFKNTIISPSFDEVMDIMPEVIWFQDQPVLSTTVVVDHLLHQCLKNDNVKVSLSGQGADEVWAGYNSFQAMRFKEQFKQGKYIASIQSLLHFANNVDLGYFKQKLGKRRTNYLTPERNLRKKEYRQSSVKELSMRYLTNDGIRYLLHYLDRTSMANSIESRVPFLDHRLVEFGLKLPSAFTHNKKLLRDSFGLALPHLIRKRTRKLGYETPEKKWIKQHYSRFIDYIEKHAITEILDDKNFKKLKQKKDHEAMFRIFSAAIFLNQDFVSL